MEQQRPSQGVYFIPSCWHTGQRRLTSCKSPQSWGAVCRVKWNMVEITYHRKEKKRNHSVILQKGKTYSSPSLGAHPTFSNPTWKLTLFRHPIRQRVAPKILPKDKWPGGKPQHVRDQSTVVEVEVVMIKFTVFKRSRTHLLRGIKLTCLPPVQTQLDEQRLTFMASCSFCSG